MAVDVAHGSGDWEASLVQAALSGGASQQWGLVDAGQGDGYFKLVNVHSRNCMDVYAGSTDDGAPERR